METQNTGDDAENNDVAKTVEETHASETSSTQTPDPPAKAAEPAVPLHERALIWRETPQGKFVSWVGGGLIALLGLVFACTATPLWGTLFPPTLPPTQTAIPPTSTALPATATQQPSPTTHPTDTPQPTQTPTPLLPTVTPAPSATPLAFQPAKSGESLIIVAEFENRVQSPIAPSLRIVKALQDQVGSGQLAGRVRVAEAKIQVQPNQFMTAEIAKKFGAAYSATLVIWGVQDGAGATAHLERVRDVTYTLAADTNVDTAPSLTDPGRLEASLVITLPLQMKYLVMLTLGAERYFSGDFAEAQPYFESAIQSTREVPDLGKAAYEPYFYLGFIAHTQNRLDDSIAAYSDSLRINPNLAVAYFDRGNAYRKKGGADNLDKAITDYTTAITLNPNFVEAYVNRGTVYAGLGGTGNLDKAVENYDKAIEVNPDFAKAYFNRGLAYRNKGGANNLDKAIADYAKFIVLKPEDADVYVNRGNAYVDKGGANNLDKAIADYTKFIALKPEDADVYVNRGNAYRKKGGANNLDKAIADYTKFITLKPEDAGVYVNRGDAYANKDGVQNLDKALADFDAAIKLDKTFAISYCGRGNVFAKHNNIPDARIAYEKCRDLAIDDKLRQFAQAQLDKLK